MTVTSSNIKLTDQQQAAVDTLASLRKDHQTLGGLAGTGKSTIIRSLVERLPRFAVCAYTGKAAQVLRRKGVEASTIHSLIYRLATNDEGEPEESVRFELNRDLEIDGVIVDEASMVGKEIYDDLVSLGLPLIFVGDHGQLEPVGAGGFNLMEHPDITLETIHRNAGEIARFADHLRRGNDAKDWHQINSDGYKYQVEVVSGVDGVDFAKVDQMICAFNATRVAINKTVREELGFPEDRPVVGDRVMCLQNDRKAMVFNGMQGVLVAIDNYNLTFSNGADRLKVRHSLAGFNSAAKPPYHRGVVPFDYAYCVTTHKAQGDEWDHVLVIEQRCSKWFHEKWSYTAASRARNKLTWVLG